MSGKLMGAGLIFLALIGGCLLWLLSRKGLNHKESGTPRRYRLQHEYDKKGFTEKGQNEGIQDVPKMSKSKPVESYQNDSFFNGQSNGIDNSSPGDKF